MKSMKKFISVLLVCVLVLSTVAVSAFAWTGNGTQQFKIETKADKEYVKAGETVTFTCIANLSTDATFDAFAGFLFSFMYNSNVMQPESFEYGPTIANFSAARPLGNITATATVNAVKAECTEADKAEWDANGYNAFIRVQCAKDANTSLGSQGYWEMGENEVLFKVTFKVAEDVADGTSVTLGVNSGLLNKKYFYVASVDKANGNKATNQVTPGLYDYLDSNTSFTVGEAAAASIIKDGGSNIRFRGIGSTGTVADYQGEFDVRTVATISEADFKAKFTDDATAIEKITDIGFVYAAKSKVATFDVATAKAVAQGTAAEGYVKAPVNYIQHEADGADYRFTCLIKNIPDADQTDAVSALAYVCFNGEYIFADAAIVADYTELYARMPK